MKNHIYFVLIIISIILITKSQLVYKPPTFWSTTFFRVGLKHQIESQNYTCVLPNSLTNVKTSILALCQFEKTPNYFANFEAKIYPYSSPSITNYLVDVKIVAPASNWLFLSWWIGSISDSGTTLWIDSFQVQLLTDPSNLLNNNNLGARYHNFNIDISAITIFSNTNDLQYASFINSFFGDVITTAVNYIDLRIDTITHNSTYVRTTIKAQNQTSVKLFRGSVLLFNSVNIANDLGVKFNENIVIMSQQNWDLWIHYPDWGPSFQTRCMVGLFRFSYSFDMYITLYYTLTAKGSASNVNQLGSNSASQTFENSIFCLSDGIHQCGEITSFYDKYNNNCYDGHTCPVATVDPGAPYISRLCTLCIQIDCIQCNHVDRNYCISCRSVNHSTAVAGDCVCDIGYYGSTATTYCHLNCTYYMPGCQSDQCSSQTYCTLCIDNTLVLNQVDATHQTCQLCSVPIPNCQQCSNNTYCNICQPQSYLRTFSVAAVLHTDCPKCSDQMIGCQLCTVGTTCDSCLPNYIQVGIVCTCDFTAFLTNCLACTIPTQCTSCDTDYFISSIDKLCYPCTTLPQCLHCTDQKTCTQCTTVQYVLVTNTALSSVACDLCSAQIAHCIECTDLATCTKCNVDSGFGVNGKCDLCSNLIQSCVLCTDYMHCTQCASNSLTFLYNNKCIHCLDLSPQCLTCVYSGIGLIPLTCTSCTIGYYLNPADNICYKCSSSIYDCEQCIYNSVLSKPQCTLCSAQFLVDINQKCQQCKQPKYHYVTRTCTNTTGCLSSQMIKGKPICLSCDSSLHFQYNAFTKLCVCQFGYNFNTINKLCQQQCGDGIAIDMKCDDGNLLNEDGCNQYCEQQLNYKCLTNTQGLSSCVLYLDITIAFDYIVRQMGQNKASLYFTVSPASTALDRVIWTDTIKFDLSQTIKTEIFYSNGVLIVTVQYSASIQDKLMTLDFNFGTDVIKSKSSGMTLKMSSVNGRLNYDSNTAAYKNIKYAGLALALGCLGLFLVSSYFHKMIGLETLQLVQLIYFMRIMCPNISQSSFFALNILKYSNGYSDLRQSSSSSQSYLSLSSSFSHLNLSLYFLDNCNLMLIPIILASIFWLIYHFLVTYYRNQYMLKKQIYYKDKYIVTKRQYNWIYDSFIFTFSLSLLYIGIFSTILYTLSNLTLIQNKPYPKSSKQFISISYGINIVILYYISLIYFYEIINGIKKYSQIDSKSNVKSIQSSLQHDNNSIDNAYHPLYVSIYLIKQVLVIGVMCLIFINLSFVIQILFSITLVYLILICYFKPYVNKIHNYSIIINQIVIVVFALIMLLLKNNIISQASISITAYIIIFMILIVLILQFIRLYVHRKQLINYSKVKQKFKNENNNNNINNKNIYNKRNKYNNIENVNMDCQNIKVSMSNNNLKKIKDKKQLNDLLTDQIIIDYSKNHNRNSTNLHKNHHDSLFYYNQYPNDSKQPKINENESKKLSLNINRQQSRSKKQQNTINIHQHSLNVIIQSPLNINKIKDKMRKQLYAAYQ